MEQLELEEIGMQIPKSIKEKFEQENNIEVEYPYSPYTEEGRERDRKRIVEKKR